MLRSAVLFLAFAAPAWAQAPLVANRPPLPDLARDLLDGSLTRGGAEPDTVAPWRYLPLEVGNAWEYESVFGNAPEWAALRIDVPKDTLIDGVHYLIWERRIYTTDGEADPDLYRRFPVRYDTLLAKPLDYNIFDGTESSFQWAPCPLDVAFDSVVDCGEGFSAEVSGTYEGVLDFEPDTTVAGVAVKTYVIDPAYMDRFAAGFGKALYYEYEDGGYHALRYARVGGEEFGTEQFPVANEPVGPEQAGRTGLEVWPNPFRDRLTAAFEVARAGPVVVEVVDVLGRVVRRRDLGAEPVGRREVALGGEGLPAGLYVVRVAAGEAQAVRRVVRVR